MAVLREPPADTEYGQARAILKAVLADLTEHPEHWGQGAAFMDSAGTSLSSDDALDVARRCLMGLCWHHMRLLNIPQARYDTTIDLLHEVGPGDLATWNDTPGRTVEEIKALLEEALQP